MYKVEKILYYKVGYKTFPTEEERKAMEKAKLASEIAEYKRLKAKFES